MYGGGGGDERGRGGVGGDFYNSSQKKIDHDGCRSPTAAMGPRSRRQSIQQSANILCNRSTLLNLENIIIINVYMTI
jgi:hypothetical protein